MIGYVFLQYNILHCHKGTFSQTNVFHCCQPARAFSVIRMNQSFKFQLLLAWTARSSSSSRALWSTFAFVCACDHTLLGGGGLDFLSPFGPPVIRWVYVWEFNPCWKEHQVACLHTHTHIRAHNLRSRCIGFFFFFKCCICREACGPHGTGPSCLLMGRFSLHSIHSDISFVRPLALSFSLSQHTRHVSEEASRGWRLCATGQKEMIMSFKTHSGIIQ